MELPKEPRLINGEIVMVTICPPAAAEGAIAYGQQLRGRMTGKPFNKAIGGIGVDDSSAISYPKGKKPIREKSNPRLQIGPAEKPSIRKSRLRLLSKHWS
jgi:hypothetical protein